MVSYTLLTYNIDTRDPIGSKKRDYEWEIFQRLFRAEEAKCASVPDGAGAPAAGARPQPQPHLRPPLQPGLGVQAQPRVPPTLLRQQHTRVSCFSLDTIMSDECENIFKPCWDYDDEPGALAWNYCGMFNSFTVNTTYGEHLR